MNAKEQQFTNIIKEHERTIYTVCYMFSSDSDEVNDLYQDILVRLWQGFDAFEGKSDIRTWIYRVSLYFCQECLIQVGSYQRTTQKNV